MSPPLAIIISNLKLSSLSFSLNLFVSFCVSLAGSSPCVRDRTASELIQKITLDFGCGSASDQGTNSFLDEESALDWSKWFAISRFYILAQYAEPAKVRAQLNMCSQLVKYIDWSKWFAISWFWFFVFICGAWNQPLNKWFWMGELLLQGQMSNMGGAALTGVWRFNWEETCLQVRSDMLWYPIPVVF
jgi:hypothetical protein